MTEDLFIVMFLTDNELEVFLLEDLFFLFFLSHELNIIKTQSLSWSCFFFAWKRPQKSSVDKILLNDVYGDKHFEATPNIKADVDKFQLRNPEKKNLSRFHIDGKMFRHKNGLTDGLSDKELKSICALAHCDNTSSDFYLSLRGNDCQCSTRNIKVIQLKKPFKAWAVNVSLTNLLTKAYRN